MGKLTKKQQQFFLNELTREAEELTGSIHNLGDADSQWAELTLSDTRSRDPLEGDSVTVERALLSQLAESTAKGSSDVRRALQKLAEGSYGLCDDCGKEIAFERLEARPRAIRCIHCA